MHSAKQISFHSVTETDLPILQKWFSNPLVADFYKGVDDSADLNEISRKYLAKDRVRRFIVNYGSEPVGYIQYYPLNKGEKIEYGYKAQKVYGLDQFIGEPDMWGKGLGSNMIRQMIGVIKKQKIAELLTMDPFTDNARAIHVYQKLGFKIVKTLREHDTQKGIKKDAYLMELRLSNAG